MIANSIALVSRVFAVLISFGFIGGSISGQEKNWKELIPLSSTQTDADEWAGKVKAVRKSNRITYYLSDMRIEIEMETGEFCSKKGAKWNVDKGTIIALTVNFMPSVPFQNLGFDRDPFKTYKYDNDLPGIFLLADVNAGRVLEVEERAGLSDLLVRVARIEPPQQMAGLKCREISRRSSQS